MRPSSSLRAVLTLAALSMSAAPSMADSPLSGDLGLGTMRTAPPVSSARPSTQAFPYVDLQSGAIFMRVDTLGVNLVPLAQGQLEFVGQWRGDGYCAPGLATRRDALPLGFETLQTTKYGALLLNALHDFGESHGALLQARYFAELDLGPVTLNPEFGFEWQSRAYTDYYFAPRRGEGASYRPGAALNHALGLIVEAHVQGPWYFEGYLRRTELAKGVADSPLVQRSHDDSGLLALAYRF